jgi:hypothetical protein
VGRLNPLERDVSNVERPNMTLMKVIIASAIPVLVLDACAGEAVPAGPTYTVESSEGVTVVTNHARAWTRATEWRVSGRPLLRIGEADGPLPFTFGVIRAVGWLPDGRVYVGDEQAHSVHVFSAEGGHLQTFGGEGNGPGELQWFLHAGPYRGDSMFVYDYRENTVNVFGPDFSFARRFRNPNLRYAISSPIADGRFLLHSTGSRDGGANGIEPDSSLIMLVGADGSTIDTIGRFQVTVRTAGPDGRWRPVYLAPSGSLIPNGDRVIWTEGRGCEYHESDAGGESRRTVRCPHEPVPVTDRVKREFMDLYLEYMSRAGAEGGPEALRQALDEGTYASELPATSGETKVDPLGNVWLGRYKMPGLYTNEWSVFDPEGVWLGNVMTPAGLTVHEIGIDRIIGVATDDRGVQFVQQHRLDRP